LPAPIVNGKGDRLGKVQFSELLLGWLWGVDLKSQYNWLLGTNSEVCSTSQHKTYADYLKTQVYTMSTYAVYLDCQHLIFLTAHTSFLTNVCFVLLLSAGLL